MVTREDALRLLENAGVENGETGTPLDRAEVTRRVLLSFHRAFSMPTHEITWRTPMRTGEDEWEYLDFHLAETFGASFGWSEAVPETVGGLIREVEHQYSHLWKRVVTDFEEKPRHCGVQATFYGVRNIVRALGEDTDARWRPGDALEKTIPPAKVVAFYRQVNGEFGVPLPLEWKVFGKLPYTFTWWALWLLISAALIGAGLTGFFLTGMMALTTFLLNVILGAVSRYTLSDKLVTLGDIARYIVAEQVGLRDRLKKMAETPFTDTGEADAD